MGGDGSYAGKPAGELRRERPLTVPRSHRARRSSVLKEFSAPPPHGQTRRFWKPAAISGPARSSLATRTVVRAGVYPDVVSRFDFWPVATTVGSSAVIGLAFDPDERPSAPDALVDLVANVLALALDRQYFRLGRDARPQG